MRSYDKKKRNNIIIGSLIGVVLLMVVGYAAFSSALNIKGTSNISSNWNVLITNVTSKNIIGGASDAQEPTWDNLTATFKTNLTAPGDSIEYDITVSNRGNLNATLDKIQLSDPNNDAIIFTTSGLTEGDTLAAGQNQILTVKVEYDKNVTSQPENTEGTLEVTLDFVQEGKEINSPVKNPANVEIASIEPTNAVGLAQVAAQPTYYGLNANLKTSLTNQDDSLEYNITIQNQGDEDAVLTGVTVNEENKIATITSSGVTEGETLQANQTKVMTVKVAKSQTAPEGQVESDLNVSLDYENKEDVTTKTYTITYNYKANGGQSSNAENASLGFGNNINLDYTAKKEGSRFIGWNTDKNATTGLKDLTVTGKNLTLYAIFKENKLIEPTVEIQKGETTANVVITYPSGCADGKVCKYSINGVEQTVTTSPVELTITEDTKLIVTTTLDDETQTVEKTIDFTAPEVTLNVNAGTSTLTAVATATDTLSDITKYEFSIDNGEWKDNGTNNIYTFTGLDQNTTHTIKVRVTNSIDLTNEATKEVTTKNLAVPTYAETETDNGKTITITYPEGCGDTLTCSYIKNDETEVTVTESTANVDFTESGTLVATVNDGRNEASSSYTVEISSGVTFGGTTVDLVTSGDGLYEDTTKTGRYVYRGGNPSNYIKFNNETWRILAVENDGALKIMKNNSIGKIAFDSSGYRDSSSNGAGGTYCTQSIYGCNAWEINDNFVNDTKFGTVLKKAELNTYLNNQNDENSYYNTLSTTAKSQIYENHVWGIGPVTSNDEDLATQIQSENGMIWNGNIVLMSLSDFIMANSNDELCGSIKLQSDNSVVCRSTNYISRLLFNLSGTVMNTAWTITPGISAVDRVWVVSHILGLSGNPSSSSTGFSSASSKNHVLPALYLKSDITLSGEGTSTNPYTIVAQ